MVTVFGVELLLRHSSAPAFDLYCAWTKVNGVNPHQERQRKAKKRQHNISCKPSNSAFNGHVLPEMNILYYS
ncbi:hypothetical protein JOB18_028108 [Solea senegalensis]|uniref:Uncharacterized protein n=1 Tax=Solea senegalensis TaxID=28829 RepID=A0AAV6QY01_SOLSE|nr:hypothetical protein JOB18_028108 [Solea senegalensis]